MDQPDFLFHNNSTKRSEVRECTRLEAGQTGSPSHKHVKEQLALNHAVSTVGAGPGFQLNQSELALKAVWDDLSCSQSEEEANP